MRATCQHICGPRDKENSYAHEKGGLCWLRQFHNLVTRAMRCLAGSGICSWELEFYFCPLINSYSQGRKLGGGGEGTLTTKC